MHVRFMRPRCCANWRESWNVGWTIVCEGKHIWQFQGFFSLSHDDVMIMTTKDCILSKKCLDQDGWPGLSVCFAVQQYVHIPVHRFFHSLERMGLLTLYLEFIAFANVIFQVSQSYHKLLEIFFFCEHTNVWPSFKELCFFLPSPKKSSQLKRGLETNYIYPYTEKKINTENSVS